MTNEPILSIVTGSFNRPEGLRALIHSVYQQTQVSWEIVVSDASDKPYPYETSAQIRILEERPRLGCVKGYNRAFREARGRFVIWLNDDATVCPHYDIMAIEFMEAHPEIGLGALYYSEPDKPFHVNEYWGMVYANFGIIDRKLGNRIGWFDDSLTMYGNDNSLAFRVLLEGKGIGSIPGSLIRHNVVLDEVKRDNQQYRFPDSRTLLIKYAEQLGRMKAVYDRTAHLAGPLVLG